MPVEEIQNIDATPKLNRIATTEDDEVSEFVDDLEDSITNQLRELY